MDDFTTTSPQDSWEYDTGRTQPPKNRGGLVALLLILVIFLTGITTVLGILNIRLFRQINRERQQEDVSISFSPPEQPSQTAAVAETTPVRVPEFSVDLQPPASSGEAPQDGRLSLQEIYRRNLPSVVSIACTQVNGSTFGSGVVLSSDGYILTNAHLVADAAAISVQLFDNRVLPARLVASDAPSDLAVLQVEAKDLIPGSFADSSDLQVGDPVVTIGDPMGIQLRATMTDGIISAIHTGMILGTRELNLIQTNAVLGAGNSGGPLINSQGQIVGIITMQPGGSLGMGQEGLGFAIPSATVKEVAEQLIENGQVKGRPTLGIIGETLSTFYQHYYNLPAGLYLTQITPESPAHGAGLEPGDILLSINDKPITSMQELKTLLFSMRIGDQVQITIYRDGGKQTVKMVIGEDR